MRLYIFIVLVSIYRDQTSALNTNDISKNHTHGTRVAKLNEWSYFQGVGNMLVIFEEKHLQNSDLNPTVTSLSYSR